MNKPTVTVEIPVKEFLECVIADEACWEAMYPKIKSSGRVFPNIDFVKEALNSPEFMEWIKDKIHKGFWKEVSHYDTASLEESVSIWHIERTLVNKAKIYERLLEETDKKAFQEEKEKAKRSQAERDHNEIERIRGVAKKYGYELVKKS